MTCSIPAMACGFPGCRFKTFRYMSQALLPAGLVKRLARKLASAAASSRATSSPCPNHCGYCCQPHQAPAPVSSRTASVINHPDTLDFPDSLSVGGWSFCGTVFFPSRASRQTLISCGRSGPCTRNAQSIAARNAAPALPLPASIAGISGSGGVSRVIASAGTFPSNA